MIRQFIAIALAAFALHAAAAVEVNQASQAELETVKGIGPGLSGKILEARKNANFKDWSDMVDRVPGIGPGNATRFSQAGLTVGGATYDGTAVPAAKPEKAVRGAKADKVEKASKPAKAQVQ